MCDNVWTISDVARAVQMERETLRRKIIRETDIRGERLENGRLVFDVYAVSAILDHLRDEYQERLDAVLLAESQFKGA